MTELSLNLLDIITNSTAAGASLVETDISIAPLADTLKIVITDNGKGMSPELLSSVASPFATTRKTRRVGMGIPLFKMAAELTGGSFKIESELGKGTVVSAEFMLSSIDRPPLGNIGETFMVLLNGSPQTDFILNVSYAAEKYTFDTREVKEALGGDISDLETLAYIKDMINENIEIVNGGNII